MQFRTKQGLQVLRRAHSFLIGHTFTAAMGDLKPQTEALAAIVLRLERHAMEQEAKGRNARESTSTKQGLARSLKGEYLQPLSLLAVEIFADNPNQRVAFKLPTRIDDEGLLQLAAGFVERATEHKARFVAKGLAEDFVERLQGAAEALRASMVTRSLHLGRRSAASAGLLEEIVRGRTQLKLIDRMLAPRLAPQPDLLAEWRTITRFARRAVVAEESTPGTTAPGSTPVPTPAPANPPSGATPVGGAPGGATVTGLQPSSTTEVKAA